MKKCIELVLIYCIFFANAESNLECYKEALGTALDEVGLSKVAEFFGLKKPPQGLKNLVKILEHLGNDYGFIDKMEEKLKSFKTMNIPNANEKEIFIEKFTEALNVVAEYVDGIQTGVLDEVVELAEKIYDQKEKSKMKGIDYFDGFINIFNEGVGEYVKGIKTMTKLLQCTGRGRKDYVHKKFLEREKLLQDLDLTSTKNKSQRKLKGPKRHMHWKLRQHKHRN